jgi:lipoic acid synthetase
VGSEKDASLRKPEWLRQRLPSGPGFGRVNTLLRKQCLHTVCEEANCPNRGECFSSQTATFLILGPKCSRDCRFCAVEPGAGGPPDPKEPQRVAQAAWELGLDYVVITSVTRDDLPDGGAGQFAATIMHIRNLNPSALVEALIPDFQGSRKDLETVLEARPDVLNHNLETVSRLYPLARPQAEYARSLELLRRCRDIDPGLPLKSGMMLGLGESVREVEQAVRDLADSGCSILTIGQYLQPTKRHLPVHRFLEPEEFEALKGKGYEAGMEQIASGPFVRSSYRAKELYLQLSH